MDPTAAWLELVQELSQLGLEPSDERLRFSVVQRLEDLAAWIERGGFPPLVTDSPF
jgi:hypothetical protein